MMSDGFYLEARSDNEPSVKRFVVKRLMDGDEIFADVEVVRTEGDAYDERWTVYVHLQPSKTYRARVKGIGDRKALGDWVRRKLGDNLGEDLFSDLQKARKAKREAGKEVWLHRLNKDGSESGMRDAVTRFDDADQALAHHKYLVKINPGKSILHHLYSRDDTGTMRAKLDNGKVLAAPGGIDYKGPTK